MIYFTADTHFYHGNVIQYERRPFQTAEEMNEALIQNWNARVSPDDDIFILGDFTLKGPSLANALLERLQGRKYLIRGNHDGYVDRASFRQDAFVWVRDQFELSWQGQRFVLCHYPFLTWNGMRRGAFHLHGHQHNGPLYNKWNRDDGLRRLDVGVDANGMAPVSAEEILAFWDEEYSDASYGRIKPGDIRLEMTCPVCPEQYDAFDAEGELIGYLRLRHGTFRVDCPECGEDTVYEAELEYGQGEFYGGEREKYLNAAKRAIAKYYRDKEAGQSHRSAERAPNGS